MAPDSTWGMLRLQQPHAPTPVRHSGNKWRALQRGGNTSKQNTRMFFIKAEVESTYHVPLVGPS